MDIDRKLLQHCYKTLIYHPRSFSLISEVRAGGLGMGITFIGTSASFPVLSST